MRVSPAAILPVFRKPRPVVEAVGFDYECVPFPSADRISQPAGFRILGKSPAIRPDIPPLMAPLDKLNNSLRKVGKLKPIIIGEPSRPTERVTDQHAVFGV